LLLFLSRKRRTGNFSGSASSKEKKTGREEASAMAEHEEYLLLISARLDGELKPEEEERLRDHLAACPDCRRAAGELRAIHEAMERLPLLEPPPDLKDRILAELEDTGKGRTGKPVWRRWLAAAAVLVVLAGVGRRALPLLYGGGSAAGGSGPDAAAAAMPRAAAGGAPSDSGESAEEGCAGAAEDSGPMAKASAEQADNNVSLAQASAGEAPCGDAPGPQVRDVNSSGPAAPEPMCAPAPESSASPGVTKDECAFSETSAAIPLQAEITPRQALELVVAQVNAESAQALRNVYVQEEERLVCANTLPEDSTIVSTVNYAGTGDDGYLFTLNGADGGELSRYAVSLDGSEVLALTP